MTRPREPGVIRVLPVAVVNRIAAGEVVERPASVVKELLENSLDAGSGRIVVEVKDGGRRLIKVSDNGDGMSRVDAAMAFQRHATSKLQSDDDLWTIRTLGFRGEALSSIAAVSKVRLLTCRQDESAGTEVQLTGGTLAKADKAAAAPGTTIEVAELFYNTPARKKFLKSPATELSHICQVVQQTALARPGVHLRLVHNGQQVFEYPAVSSRRDRILQVYGAEVARDFVVVQGEHPGVVLEGYAVDAARVRTKRTPQDVFVNLRPVKNAAVLHAVYDGYGPSLAKGRHPVFVLFLDVDPGRVDVNVHPTKREVRFAEQDVIHSLVRQAIRKSVGGASPPFQADRPGQESTLGSQAQGQAGRGLSVPRIAASGAAPLSPGGPRGEAAVGGAPQTDFWKGGHAGSESGATTTVYGDVREAQPVAYLAAAGEVIPFGQLRRTFLVAQVGTELQIVDQHTAHERVLYERLWRGWRDRQIPSQALLLPQTFELPPHQVALLAQHLEDLEQLGLEIAVFGPGSFVIRSVPVQFAGLDYPAFVQDLLDDLAQWTSLPALEARIRPVLATVACHSAVRAGRSMELPEMKQLLEDWVAEGMPMTCPHGRRVAFRLPEDELARVFGRT